MITISRLRLLALLTTILALGFAAGQSRIVSLSGDATEILFGLGAQENIVAVDATSNYPAEANELPNVGYHGQLSAEGLFAFDPTHVIVNSSAGPEDVLSQLEDSGVEIVRLAEDLSLETPIENIRLVAELVGEEERGEELAQELQEKFDTAAQQAAEFEEQPRVLFLYLGSTRMQFAGGDETASNVMIEGAGAIDVGKEVGFVGNVPFTPEAVVTANPNVLLVTERGLNTMGSIDAILEIPGIAQTPAAEQGNVIVFEDLYLLGMGPRSGDALLELVEQLHDMQ